MRVAGEGGARSCLFSAAASGNAAGAGGTASVDPAAARSLDVIAPEHLGDREAGLQACMSAGGACGGEGEREGRVRGGLGMPTLRAFSTGCLSERLALPA